MRCMELDNIVIDIIIGVLASLISSVIFWFLTFKLSRTKLVFSDYVEKSQDKIDPETCRYRIKTINIGNRDLYEVSFVARLVIKAEDSMVENVCSPALGDGINPVFRGKRFQNKKTINIKLFQRFQC